MDNKLAYTITMLFFLFSVIQESACNNTGYAYNNISTESLQRKMEYMTAHSNMGRLTGSKGMMNVTTWISMRFKEIGLIPLGEGFVHNFKAENGTIGRNIVGFMPSGKGFSNFYTIIMAHYDGLGIHGGITYPGADSNASGTIAMISMAEMFSFMRSRGKKYDGNIIFIATDAKHINMGGVRDFVNKLTGGLLVNPCTSEIISPGRISLVVNIDQIGSSLSPITKGNPDYLIMLGRNSLSGAAYNSLGYKNWENNIFLEIAYDYYGSIPFSDLFYKKIGEHVYFLGFGAAVTFFTSGITVVTNKKEDNSDNIDYGVFHKRLKLLFLWLEDAVQKNQRKLLS